MESILDWCANKRPRKPVTYIECSALRNIQVGDIFLVAGDYTYDYLNAIEDAEEEEVEDEGDDREGEHHGRCSFWIHICGKLIIVSKQVMNTTIRTSKPRMKISTIMWMMKTTRRP
jgi:hypothetical protein